MKINYENSQGQIIDFTKPPYKMLTDTDLFHYEWSYETKKERNPRITKFDNLMVQKSLKVVVQPANQSVVNNLLEITEKDVVNLTPGKLYVNDAYLRCYMIKSQKNSWNKKGFYVNEYTLVAEDGSWIYETFVPFRPDAQNLTGGKNLDFGYDYPFDYASGMAGKMLNNASYAPVDFDMTIYGACMNPAVHIAGHKYRINCQLETGEYLKINSNTKKIYKVKINGEVINQFHLRDRESYLFEKIAPGKHSVTWNGNFGFDILLLEKRSEPQWI